MDPRLACAVLSAALLCSCAHSDKGKAPDPAAAASAERAALAPEVQLLAERAEKLIRTQDELVWANWTQGKPANIAATYEGEETLFTPDALKKVDRLISLTDDPREVRALTSLQTYLVGEYLARGLAEITDALANLQASLTFTANGKEHALRDLDRLLANERDPAKRRALYEGATPAIERLSQSVRRKEEKVRALLGELGYPSYEAFASELRQTDLERLALLAEEILQVTEAPYRQVIDKLAQHELGLPLEKLQRADLPRLFKPTSVDASFPKEQILPRLQATLAPMGLELSKLPGLTVDDQPAPRKNPRPLTLGIRVPGDVRLAITPAGGAHDQARALHEVGHALHFALTEEKRFELAKLGNPTVGEAYAQLFQDLMSDPVWLEQQAGLSGEKLQAYLATTSAQRLFAIRRAAGLLVYQLRARQAPADLQALYTEVMARTFQMEMTPADSERYLVDLEDFYQSADDFRAWFLAGQLQGQLKARFGPAWWKSPEAGTFLRKLFARGNAASAREIAQEFGDRRISPDVLLLRLGSTLGVPMTLPTTPLEPAAPAPAPAARVAP